ncbi:hypothetical protein KAI60_01630 [Candidatus Bathyarchaeota archaeon]|nr:hypothetical protein [Candidatus Bathyarchaeota archaeon]
MAGALRWFSYRELINLIICIFLDSLDYIIPILRLPLIGDLFDLLGLAIAFVLFGWIGLISLFEFVPGLDLLPMSTVNWIIWIYSKRSKEWSSEEQGRFGRFK